MSENTMIPVADCKGIDLSDVKNVDRIALHETGHLIAMYALNMMDHFSYITINPGVHNNEVGSGEYAYGGLTEVTQEYKMMMNKYSVELSEIASDMVANQTNTKIRDVVRKTKIDGAQLYLPNIIRLFGGGAICRHYFKDYANNEGVMGQVESDCIVDYNNADTLLAGLGLSGKREMMKALVDSYLELAFVSFDTLIKTIYCNLKEYRTLDREDVLRIIDEWENKGR